MDKPTAARPRIVEFADFEACRTQYELGLIVLQHFTTDQDVKVSVDALHREYWGSRKSSQKMQDWVEAQSEDAARLVLREFGARLIEAEFIADEFKTALMRFEDTVLATS